MLELRLSRCYKNSLQNLFRDSSFLARLVHLFLLSDNKNNETEISSVHYKRRNHQIDLMNYDFLILILKVFCQVMAESELNSYFGE